MNWARFDRRKRKSSVGKIIFWLLAVGGIASAVLYFTSPAHINDLPKPVKEVAKKIGEFKYSMTEGKLLLGYKDVKAMKTAKFAPSTTRYSKGIFSESQKRSFEISPTRRALVKLETFTNKKSASMVFRGAGGTKEDQLYIGAPSFFETHGADKETNYYMVVRGFDSNHIATVTMTKVLRRQEKAALGGKNYENKMNAYADSLLPLSTKILKKQIDKLKKERN